MASAFRDRMDELQSLIGEGGTVGTVEVDQIYAHYQHEGVTFKHPLGGQAKFLEFPLYDGVTRFMQRIADRLLEDGPVPPMIDNMEDLSDKVAELSPVEFGDLRDSGHPTVTWDGETVYDRAPVAHRLSEEELKSKAKLRRLGFKLEDRSQKSLRPQPLEGKQPKRKRGSA